VAQAIGCDICNKTGAMLLITFLGNGDTLGVCPECFPDWADITVIEVKKALQARDAGPAPGAIEEQVDRERAENAPVTRAPKRTARSKAAAVEVESETPTEAAASDGDQ